MMQERRTDDSFDIIATTLFGLEQVLAEELKELGAQHVKVGNRVVEFSGNQRLLYKANLWCRTAIRILKPIRSFRARDERELYKQVRRINWTDVLDVDQTLAIDAVVNRSTFEHSLFVAQLTKDAIVDQFKEKTGDRPSVDLVRPDIRLNLHMHENFVTLSLDSSGDSLHRRGYRLQTNVAPLNEALAAGIIYLTGWDKKSPLLDPMCGSGTLLTEAAMMALNIAPGLYRRDGFAFVNWKDFDPQLFKEITQEAEAAELSETEAEIYGSDLDSDYIEAAENNLRSAGLQNVVWLREADFKNLTPPAARGTLVMNPPYGERIQSDDINRLYKMIGDTLKTNFEGWDAFVFTGNLEAAKSIGLRTSRRIPLYNGAIECRLLKYELYKGSRKNKEE